MRSNKTNKLLEGVHNAFQEVAKALCEFKKARREAVESNGKRA